MKLLPVPSEHHSQHHTPPVRYGVPRAEVQVAPGPRKSTTPCLSLRSFPMTVQGSSMSDHGYTSSLPKLSLHQKDAGKQWPWQNMVESNSISKSRILLSSLLSAH